ncbi:MAG: ATP-binding cassette domain-containing protein [Bifidobacterium tibiigranuli]|uniref:methionine ABC transporter ATP-binding protein n=1 Tax=Bifidobacterium tibiigranuli TaxID=2172043 RepID=UPI0026ED30C0|nr:ATP-binding cassette domain-containing protein [Bifidobacterium tibiigranuli]MCI1673916.1 ATP-binding cassette domain-containing protein [Bifidobacterium tibiigranuli]MCI1712165.1 ATP-binding cassette domain-containing protein [Bifidobacterium tibiigranuli]MCI1834277.1 ATP-binding cassette domain-containing protein [Bifidobacterium tibiigranuli]
MSELEDPVVRFEHVSKTYHADGQDQHALHDVSFDVPAHSFFGVIGSSGAGKSTLIRTVNGLERPTSGTVTALGKNPAAITKAELSSLRREIGMIFQHYNLLQSKTVAENVAIPLLLAHTAKDTIGQRVQESLRMVGLSEHAQSYPSQLSGGQCQRVGIARALVTNPAILLSDEATSALDPVTTRQILDLLNDINSQYGISVLLITHQMSVIARSCQQVAVLDHGDVVERGAVSQVFSHPSNPLTRQFVETVVPRQLPEALAARIAQGEEGTAVLIRYRDDAAKHVLAALQSSTGAHEVALLHANENALRDVSIGQLVVSLQGADGATLGPKLGELATDDLEFEVLHE